MTNPLLRTIPIAALFLFLADSSADVAAADSIRSKVEEFVGYPLEAIVCEPIEEKHGSPIDQKTCDYFVRKSLETCWNELSSLFPKLKKPVDEYNSWLDPNGVDQMRETVHGCIKEGTFLSNEDTQKYWELRSGRRAIEIEEKDLATSWMNAVESPVSQYATKREEILGIVEAFQSSHYKAVYLPVDDLVIGAVEKNGSLVTSELETTPPWVASMKSLGFTSVDRFSSSASIYSESRLVTDEHEFIFQIRFEEAVDLPKCNASFSNIDCGACWAMESNDFNVLVTWLSQSLMKELGEVLAEDPEQESAQGKNQNDDRLARCIEDGIEQARALEHPATAN